MDDELALRDINERVVLTDSNVGPADSLLTWFLLDGHGCGAVEEMGVKEMRGGGERGEGRGRERQVELELDRSVGDITGAPIRECAMLAPVGVVSFLVLEPHAPYYFGATILVTTLRSLNSGRPPHDTILSTLSTTSLSGKQRFLSLSLPTPRYHGQFAVCIVPIAILSTLICVVHNVNPNLIG